MLIIQYKAGATPATAFIYAPPSFVWSTPGSPTNIALDSGSLTSWDPDHYETNNNGQVLAWRTGNGTFNHWARSTDGLNWTEFQVPGMDSARGAIWHTGDNKWKVVGRRAGGGFICAESSDMVTWTTLFSTTDTSIQPVGGHSLVSDGTDLVMCATSISPANEKIARSVDGGTTWSSYINTPVDSAGYNHQQLYYKGGKYYLFVSDAGTHPGLYTSETAAAVTWTGRINYGGFDGPSFIEYGNGVWLLTSYSTGNPSQNLMRSTDGETFTAVPGTWPLDGADSQVLAYDAVHGWLYVNGGLWKSSTDGLTWVDTNFGTSEPTANSVIRFK